MVRTAIDPEKPVCDDRHRGHQDDGHEEEILQADTDTKKEKVTNKHHQRDSDQKVQVRDHWHG